MIPFEFITFVYNIFPYLLYISRYFGVKVKMGQLIYISYIYRVSVKKGHGGSLEEIKENKKVLYHFANFAIVNELLIIKNRHISPAYWLMQARDEMRPPCQRGC